MSVEAKNSQIFIPHKPYYYVASGGEFQFYEWFVSRRHHSCSLRRDK